MTKKAYKLAALFFFIIGITGIFAAVCIGADRFTTVSYLVIGIMGLFTAGAVRFAASR